MDFGPPDTYYEKNLNATLTNFKIIIYSWTTGIYRKCPNTKNVQCSIHVTFTLIKYFLPPKFLIRALLLTD